jgi:hypothetical protein
MRSDRNPYFFLKKSRDPGVQALLSEANLMSETEIQALKIKPDLKKAMLFVKQFGDQVRTNTTAELIAEEMSRRSVPTLQDTHEIWQYQGRDFLARSVRRGWIDIQPHDLFIRDRDRMFVRHNWCWFEPCVQKQSHLVTEGSFQTLNQLIKLGLQKKWGQPGSGVAISGVLP